MCVRTACPFVNDFNLQQSSSPRGLRDEDCRLSRGRLLSILPKFLAVEATFHTPLIFIRNISNFLITCCMSNANDAVHVNGVVK